MARFLDEVKKRYDVVLFDSAPLLPVTDAAVLAAALTGALVVANATKVRRAQFSDAVTSVEQVGAKVLGVVINGSPSKNSPSYYGYASRVSDAPGDAADADAGGSRRGASRRRSAAGHAGGHSQANGAHDRGRVGAAPPVDTKR
jgi:Mrp family chromosome partitioning ATPase